MTHVKTQISSRFHRNLERPDPESRKSVTPSKAPELQVRNREALRATKPQKDTRSGRPVNVTDAESTLPDRETTFSDALAAFLDDKSTPFDIF